MDGFRLTRDCQKQMIISWFHSATLHYWILDDTKLIKMEEAPFSRETKKEAMHHLDYLSMPGCRFQNHISKVYKDLTADEAIFQMPGDSEVEV